MKMLLIRHGERTYKGREEDNPNDPLSAKGESQVEALAARLKSSDKIPTLFLTSRYRHAQQTAEILRSNLNSAAPLVPLDSLTPFPPASSPWLVKNDRYVGTILGELSASQPSLALSDSAIIAVVLHHPRQIQVALQLQGHDPRNWGDWKTNGREWPDFAQAVCLTANNLGEFDRGEGNELITL